MMKPNKIIVKEEKVTLVFLHYFGGSANSWKWVIDLISDEFNCVTLDLPGFGSSKADPNPSIENFASFVQQEISKLNIKRYQIVGHSMGGKIALQVALNDRLSKLIEHVILFAPSPPTVERMPEDDKRKMLNHPNVHEAETSVRNNTIMPLTDEQYALAVSTQNITDDKTWRWWIEEGMNHSIAEGVNDLVVPITLIASEDDPAVTYKMTLEDTIPNLPKQTLFIKTKDIGHLYPLEDPNWVAEIIRKIVIV